MSEQILPHRTQWLFRDECGNKETEELLLRCYCTELEPAKAAALLGMSETEVESRYLWIALSIARLELHRLSQMPG